MAAQWQQRVVELERVFTGIWQDRMQDVPILNPRLRVEAVSFRPHGEDLLGVLVTPWFMNLVLLPVDKLAWENLRIGRKVQMAFPAGNYLFIAGNEPGLGGYLSCSMFSPVFEFEDHEAARATAEAILELLFQQDLPEGLPEDEGSPERPLLEEEVESQPVGAAQGEQPPETVLSHRMEEPVSRRALLRGLLPGGQE